MTAGPAPIALTGPTACGKSAAALALARALRPQLAVEIISVDSALVYRGMDIGTAKPSAAERAELPHHLIDIRDPTQAYSAADFCADAHRLVGEIRSRGALPLLVGGTMLYLKALRDGLAALPAADARVRAAIDARALREGWPALHAELARWDPVTAARLPPTDAQRIQRALEVWQLSGKPLSAWHAEGAQTAAWPGLPIVSLEPTRREALHRRIGERFDAMLAAGFVYEVQALRARGDLHAGLPAMRCVGYRQAWAALDAGSLAGLREAGIAATRQLAKRQLTWLRQMPDRLVISCDAGPAEQTHAAMLDAVRQRLTDQL